MPIETESSHDSSSGRPGVSVSEAFNIPQDWSLATSLRGVAGEKSDISVQPEKPEGTPEPDQMEREGAKPAPPAEQGVEADRKEAAEAEAARKEREAAKPAAPAKGAEKPTGAAKPAAPAKPAAKPAAGAKPAAPAAKPETAPGAAAPAKIKIGDKEYTTEELEKLVNPKPAAESPAAPAAPAAPAKTKEQQEAETAAAAEAEQRQDSEWIAQTIAKIDAPLDEKTLDTILTGGKEAVVALQEIRKRDIATTLLSARKDIFAQLKPALEAIDNMRQERLAAEDTRIENEMVSEHPHLDTPQFRQLSRTIAAEMVKQPGFKVKDLNEFKNLVAQETTNYVRQFNPNFGQPAQTPGGEAPATPAAPAAAGAAKPTPGAAKPAPRRSPPPPSGHVPGTAAAGGGRDRNFQKSAVESMM